MALLRAVNPRNDVIYYPTADGAEFDNEQPFTKKR